MAHKILVTGAAGFVGRQVVRALAGKDVKLILVVRDGAEGALQTLPNVERIVSTPDLFAEDVQWWEKLCEGVETVIHVAWYVEPGQYLESPKNLDCLIGSLNLAKAAVSMGVRRFVGIGTCFEYDLSAGTLSVETALKPWSLYARAKAGLYLSLSHWLPKQSVEFVWCRLFYLYGEGEDERRLVPRLRLKLEKGQEIELVNGQKTRDFLDVESAGQMISEIALGNQQGPVNICSGIPTTVRQMAEKIADEYGQCHHLLKFEASPDQLTDPPCVVGVPNFKVCDS